VRQSREREVSDTGSGAPPTALRLRAASVLALACYAAGVVAVAVALRHHFVVLVLSVAAVLLLVLAGWFAVIGRGARRALAAVAAAGLVVGVVVALVAYSAVLDIVVIAALFAVASLLARYSLALDRRALRAAGLVGRPTARPVHAVLLMNPRSGGGKVVRFDLHREAARRGIEAVTLEPGNDLDALARDAVRRGADVLGMAGGDGSQALVAAIASECDLPYVCIPAGTRNHLALDLGVDREDVVGSLDAFVDGFERRIDLARVNGRVFVNNVSLGVYAEIVQSDAYRDAKLQTAADMLSELLGPTAPRFSFELTSDAGERVQDACLVLVSNNVYALDRLSSFGSRARIDQGVLGVVALRVSNATDLAQLVACELAGRVRTYSGWRQWTTRDLEIRAATDVAVGVDGESLRLPAPLRFEIVPGALRVRLAPSALGRSPGSIADAVRQTGLRGLVHVAAGHTGEGAPEPA